MLSWAERLTLWNQYEILKRLNPESAKEYEKNQEIVSDGYEQFYADINPSINRETVKEDVSQEVLDILDMFRAINFSCDRLKYLPKGRNAEFDGFDGNAAGPHYGLARFVRKTLGLFEEMEGRPDNSHTSSSLGTYRRMMAEWQKLGKPHQLTAEQIEQIAS